MRRLRGRVISWLAPICLTALSAALAWPPPKVPKEMIPPDMPAEMRRHIEVLYDHAPDQQKCGEALSALLQAGEAPDPLARAGVAEALGNDMGGVREDALRTLVAMGSPRVVELLTSRMRDRDWHMRWVAADGLGKLKSRDGVGALVEGLSDPHWYVRSVAAGAFGAVGDKSVVPKLVTALQDEHWYVRCAARESLTNLTGRGFGVDYGKWREWLDSVGSP